MQKIKIVDARMGRGKSSAAIQYMKDHRADKHFLYITPLLSEVERICTACGFSAPEDVELSKSADLKRRLRTGESIAATHALFYLMDEEALSLIRERHYTLIVDEEIEVISKVQITNKDLQFVKSMIEVDDVGHATWTRPEYRGKLDGYKEIAESGFMFILDGAMLEVVDPGLFDAFDDVYMLTYLFSESVMEAYMKYAGFEWQIIGVERVGNKYKFTDHPDAPPPLDISKLIHIVDEQKMNATGDSRTAMSHTWYTTRSYDNPDVTMLRKNLDNFFRHKSSGKSGSRMWTTFQDSAEKLVPANGRYRKNFVQVRARATNAYVERTDLAYMANRFADPNIKKFFAAYDIHFNNDVFALSEMLQWIWRSAIRNDKPINLYIPSSRMRTILLDWIDQVSKGGDACGRTQVQEMSAS